MECEGGCRRQALTSGGNRHCLTRNQPAADGPACRMHTPQSPGILHVVRERAGKAAARAQARAPPTAVGFSGRLGPEENVTMELPPPGIRRVSINPLEAPRKFSTFPGMVPTRSSLGSSLASAGTSKLSTQSNLRAPNLMPGPLPQKSSLSPPDAMRRRASNVSSVHYADEQSKPPPLDADKEKEKGKGKGTGTRLLNVSGAQSRERAGWPARVCPRDRRGRCSQPRDLPGVKGGHSRHLRQFSLLQRHFVD